MPRTFPFHAAAEPVYHDNSACKTGEKIPPEKRLKGNEGKPLCKECAVLNSEGK